MQILQLPNVTVELLCCNSRSRAKQLINIATASKTSKTAKAVAKHRTADQPGMLVRSPLMRLRQLLPSSNVQQTQQRFTSSAFALSELLSSSSSCAETLLPLWQSWEALGQSREWWRHSKGAVHHRGGEKSGAAAGGLWSTFRLMESLSFFLFIDPQSWFSLKHANN